MELLSNDILETVNTTVNYSEQLDQILESVNGLLDVSNNVLGVNFVFLNFFILFGICTLIYLFFKNF